MKFSETIERARLVADFLERAAGGKQLTQRDRFVAKVALGQWKTGASLDSSFGIKLERGEPPPGKTLALAERDSAIRVVAAYLNNGESVRARAAEIVRIVRTSASTPEDIRDEVDLLRRTGIPGDRQLRRLVESNDDIKVGHAIRDLCPTSSLMNHRNLK